MAYIWNDYSPENEYKIAEKNISPYMEVWDRDHNHVYVNILYRIYRFLMPESVLNSEEKLNRQMELYVHDGRYADIANLTIHAIARSDFLKGLSLQDFAEQICLEEIENGRYGDKVRRRVGQMKDREKRILLRYLAKYNLDHQRETVFDAALNTMFRPVRLYYENSTDIIYVYIGEEKSQYNLMIFELCEYFFKDAGVKTEVMWKGQHFGIIGIDESMIIGETALV